MVSVSVVVAFGVGGGSGVVSSVSVWGAASGTPVSVGSGEVGSFPLELRVATYPIIMPIARASRCESQGTVLSFMMTTLAAAVS